VKALALSALLLLAGPPAAEDLLPNGGFEKGLAGWTASNPSGVFKAEIDGKTRRAGKASAHLVKKGGPAAFRADALTGAIPSVPAGGKVAVSAQVKGKDVENAWLKFQAFDASGEGLIEEVSLHETILSGTFDWKELTKEFDVPGEAVRAELSLYLYRDGEAWLDEATVTPIGPPPKKAPPKTLDAATRKWLDGNAVKVRSIDFKGPLDDLAPLKEILKDARIVQLGENTHGDGACFAAKARLARFLHEEMGFEVLAFESGLYECDRANDLLKKGDADGAMENSIFGIWNVPSVRPLFRWMADRAKGEKPLLLAGFDCRASDLDAAGRMWDEVGGAKEDLAAVRRLDALMKEQEDAYRPPEKDLAAGLAALERIRAGVTDPLLQRCVDNWKAREAFERSKSQRGLGEYGSINLRDAAMADNLRWLAEVRHPGKKIVAWGATFHLARNLLGVKMDGNAKHYEGCRNMGQGVFEAFGKSVYTVGFAAWGGKAGSFTWKSDLGKPRDGSVEDTLHRYGAPFLFVDLRREGPFAGNLKMAPMSYGRNIEAKWPDVLDAVFFIDEMTPAK
jgi:erythromycin esterase